MLDEAQRIKNWQTKTALSVKGLAPPYRLVLTGTPMENRIDELASVVEWVDDMALEPKWRLNPVHAIRADGRKEMIGVRHLATIRDRLRHCMVRRVRQDVLDQLPPRTDTRVPVEMTEAQTGRARRAGPADRHPDAEGHDAAADPGGIPPPDEPADAPADHLQRPGAGPVRGHLADDPRPTARGGRAGWASRCPS